MSVPALLGWFATLIGACLKRSYADLTDKGASLTSQVEFVLVYTTAPDFGVAEAIGGQLVEEGLAACVNVLPGMRSIYSWRGEIQRDDEVVALIKTRSVLAERVVDRIEELHPYEVPAAFVISTSGGSTEFLKWVAEQTVITA